MKPSDHSRQLFLDMQEHPEKYSGQQIEAMMDELDEVPDAEAAWQEFISERLTPRELSTLKPPIIPRWGMKAILNSQFSILKVAASFIGILLLSGLTLAAVHLWRPSSVPSREGVESSVRCEDVSTQPLPSLTRGTGGETITFDNVPLDTMLMEMASYYHVAVGFQREEARQLRFHFVWKRSESLDRVLERLNHFEAIHIKRDGKRIIVE